MVTWTKEQQDAIDRSGADMLVAAAAGSGKTAVLVERIIQKIINKEDPIDIDEIMVATFTNAAAEEMRNRIGTALKHAIDQDPTSHHLKKQLSLLQRASISTLHSFCTRVVRQYAYLIDVDPAFRIADDMEIDVIRQEVMDELLEDAYSREGEELEAFYQLVDMFSSDRSDTAVGELILKLYQFSNEHPQPDEWLDEVSEAYQIGDEEETGLVWLDFLKNHMEEELAAFEKIILSAIDIAKEPDGPYHYLEALENDLQLIEIATAKVHEWNEMQQLFQSAHLKSLSRKKVDCNEDKKDAIKHLRGRFRDEWNKLKKSWFSRDLQGHRSDMQTLYPSIHHLTKLVLEFRENFTKAKREKAIVDFSDLEHFCLHILSDPASSRNEPIPSSIAQQYQKQFKEILVDEYQDINIVQETILLLISDQTSKGNRFMVGDVKQSIYRFRHAEPTLFLEKYKQYAKDPSEGIRIDLAKNFRSRSNVIDGANYIFKQIMDETLGEIAYDDKAALVYGNLTYDELPIDSTEMELMLIDKETEEVAESKEGGESPDDLINAQLEARVYARKIKQWIGSKTQPPLQIVDKATGQKRNIQYRDIVILLRSLTDAPTIVDELKKQGIPVHAELRTGYFKAIEIQVMINMLKIIDNPYQDIPLASVLRSPIVGLNEENLAQIRLTKQHESFYEALQVYAVKNEEQSQRVQRFLNQLKQFQLLARQGALSELIWEIYLTTGYYDFVGGIPGGRQRQANLRALYDRSRSYENTSFRGLFRFLRFIERLEEQNQDLGEARALSEQEDVVRIMTIHKSKGLEFPVVMIGGMYKQFNLTDLRMNYIFDKDLGFATKFIDPIKRITYPTLYYLALQQAALKKLLAEEMRVLYVAMTRAKEKLVMIGNVPSVKKMIDNWSEVVEHPEWILPSHFRKKTKTYLDWVGPALIRHRNNELIRHQDQTPDILQDVYDHPSKWKIHIIPFEHLMDMENELATSKKEWKHVITNWDNTNLDDQGSYSKVDRILSFEYPYKKATETKAKESVTEIKRRQEVVDAYSEQQFIQPFRAPLVKRPRFLQKEIPLSAAEIGTAMHAVMQHIRFDEKPDKYQLEEFLDSLIDKEILTEKEGEAIDIPSIVQFFNSEVAQKIQSSHHMEREVPFTYTLDVKEAYPNWQGNEGEKVLIQGVVDCLIHTDEGLIILDYKTDTIHEAVVTEEVIEKLKERYHVQLSLYKQAIEDILNERVHEAYLYFFSKDLVVKM